MEGRTWAQPACQHSHNQLRAYVHVIPPLGVIIVICVEVYDIVMVSLVNPIMLLLGKPPALNVQELQWIDAFVCSEFYGAHLGGGGSMLVGMMK